MGASPTRIVSLERLLDFLIKSMVVLEGTSRLISPRFNLIELMQPFRRKMVLRRISPRRRMQKLRKIYGELEYLAQMMPRRLGGIAQP